MTAKDDARSSAYEEPFALTTSRHFPEWLASVKHSLAFTTYRAGKVFFLGVKPDGKLSVFERSFSRCMGMGMSADARSMLLTSEYQIHRLDNILPEGTRSPDGTDATFAPHQSWVTGDLDIHDIGFGRDGKPVFINTLFNCIATVSDGYSFKPLWKPPFISRYAAEDRCHLNGMALEQGEAKRPATGSQAHPPMESRRRTRSRGSSPELRLHRSARTRPGWPNRRSSGARHVQ